MSCSPIAIGRVLQILGARLLVEKPNALPGSFEGWAIDRDITLSSFPPGIAGPVRRGRARIVMREFAGSVMDLGLAQQVLDAIPAACEGDWVYVMPEQRMPEQHVPYAPIAIAGKWRVYFNRHGATGRPWCVAPDAGGWELAVPSVGIATVAETVYHPKATPDDEDGRPSAWIAVEGQLTVLATGHATIGAP